MSHQFVDDIIDHKEDDIVKIQTKPNMYISYLGRDGALHLSKEVINNMIDECINTNSPGKNILVALDEIENTLTVSDDGRGIPFDKMELVCTKLQAGSKFTREGSGGTSAGENGVGLTAVNAVSEYFEIISTRGGRRASVKFERGQITQPTKERKIPDTEAHGTTTVFKPSPFFLGDDCEIDTERLMEWLDKVIVMVPKHITITFTARRKGREGNVNKKYKNKNGLYDIVKKLSKKPIIEPVHFTGADNSLTEYDKGRTIPRELVLETAFTFNSSPSELVVESFCNFVNTVEHGVHVDATRNAITAYFTKLTRDGLSDRDAKRLEITSSDVMNGLVLSVYLSTTMQPQFSGQTKEKMTSKAFSTPIRRIVTEQLEAYFSLHPKELKKICDYVRANARARYEATKVRNSVVRGTTSILDEHEIKSFTPANNRGKNDYRELYLIEGDSAAGSANSGRFKNFQATFGLRGVPLNAYKAKLDKVLANNEFGALVRILGANVGERFDLAKMKYQKVIIMTDSDVDGNNIFSLLCAFFLRHMPDVINKGMLYKAVAPLYRIKDKSHPYVLNKKEYVQVFEKRIRNNVKLIDPKDNRVLKSAEVEEFLFINRQYLEELSRLALYFAVDRRLVEIILSFTTVDETGVTKVNKELVRRILAHQYPEMTLDDSLVLSGIHEGKYQILNIDDIFMRRAKVLHTLMHTYNKSLGYIIHEKNGKDFIDHGTKTIGDFMAMCQKFQPVIEVRYKGIGELNPEELRETTLDPNNRILIQLTMKDIKDELKKFDVLHGDDSEGRKEMMALFKLNREDFDN